MTPDDVPAEPTGPPGENPDAVTAVNDGPGARRRVVRDGLGIGLATGTYGISFGALAVASGLDVLQACALSALMFTGGSQFAFVGVVAGGGSPFAGAASAALLGARNAFYGLHLSRLLGAASMGPLRRLAAAQLVIDESAAMALNASGGGSARLGRVGFWSTGLAVYAFWNLATLLGAAGAQMLASPASLGLDAVAPAAFVALVAPRLVDSEAWRALVVGALVALVCVPFLPAGVPVLVAAAVVAAMTLLTPDRSGIGDAVDLPESDA